MKELTGKKVLVRGINSGVYFGTLENAEGSEVKLSDVRNIWYWEGANCLADIAKDGIDAEKSKVSQTVSRIIFTDICEIIECSDRAIANLEGIKAWKYREKN